MVSLGYTKETVDPDIFGLYNPNIDDIFNGAHYLNSQTKLDFYSHNGETYVKNPNRTEGLKSTTGIYTYENLNDPSYMVHIPVGTDENDLYHDDRFVCTKGYFVPVFPEVANDPFTYSWSSSSSLVKEVDENKLDVDINGDGLKNGKFIMFDFSLLKYAGNAPKEFNNTEFNMEIDVRLSLSASVTVGGIVYSRVIQSYTAELYSNKYDYNTNPGHVSANVLCNYQAREDSAHPSANYNHGNNIGFLVGHLDGTLENSYVYKGSLKFNDDSTNCHPIACESETGLVGEVGTNVVNALNPEYNATVNGAIGVMNFTKIYEGIRSDFTGGETIKAGTESGNNFLCYDTKINHSGASLFNLYEDYLRHTINGNFITNSSQNYSGTWVNHTVPGTVPEAYNTVDFLYNNLIQDDNLEDNDPNNDKDRGLGVFKIATPRITAADAPASYGDHVFDGLGNCRIINGSAKNKVYFSTAEYAHVDSNLNNLEGQKAWGITSEDIDPLRATTLPTNTDIMSFDYPFSRDFNYVFELDLTQNSSSKKHNYMFNTDSEFLTNYLSSILIDKNGRSIEHGNYRFGFMLRSSDNIALTSLSSYMEIGEPTSTSSYPDGNRYPSNSIVFRIENQKGANISVIGNTNNISIYRFKLNGSNVYGGKKIQKLYTMKCENVSDLDSHRYFTYDYRTEANGATSTCCLPYSDNHMGDNNALYAHIFKLPQSKDGEMYCIGSSSSTKAKLYYLAVQGQTNGTLDTDSIAELDNHLDNVDFLTTEPTKSNYTSGGYAAKRAYITFNGTFNTTDGELSIGTKTVSASDYLLFEFNNDPAFITQMTAFDFKTIHAFYVNNEAAARDLPSEDLV